MVTNSNQRDEPIDVDAAYSLGFNTGFSHGVKSMSRLMVKVCVVQGVLIGLLFWITW